MISSILVNKLICQLKAYSFGYDCNNNVHVSILKSIKTVLLSSDLKLTAVKPFSATLLSFTKICGLFFCSKVEISVSCANLLFTISIHCNG